MGERGTSGLAVGRSVHFVSRGSADGLFDAEHRAAIVTEVWDKASGLVSVCVLNPMGFLFQEEVAHDEGGTPGTWHWPEHVD